MPVSITARDILKLKSTEQFFLVAGEAGLSRQLDMVDMLDFGWEREREYSQLHNQGNLFDERSIVISSLQFAKNDPDKLYNTVSRLIQCGVVALAYKPVYYQELPRSVCELAERNSFAIFCINGNATYREIILDISNAIKLHNDIVSTAENLSRMLREKLSVEEVAELASQISPNFRGHAKVALIVPDSEEHAFSVDYIIRSFRLCEEYRKKAVLCGFRFSGVTGLALIATMDKKDIKKFDIIIAGAFRQCGVDETHVYTAYSNIHPTFTELNQCVYEAAQALTACRVLGRRSMQYNDLGTLSFLIPSVDNPYVRTYMQRYLKPVLENEESMRTAIAFVRAEGDYAAAAEELCLHKNTLRYRINRLHETLSPNLGTEPFYECLSTAVKIYLITLYRE